jgi:hypothetical protein
VYYVPSAAASAFHGGAWLFQGGTNREAVGANMRMTQKMADFHPFRGVRVAGFVRIREKINPREASAVIDRRRPVAGPSINCMPSRGEFGDKLRSVAPDLVRVSLAGGRIGSMDIFGLGLPGASAEVSWIFLIPNRDTPRLPS